MHLYTPSHVRANWPRSFLALSQAPLLTDAVAHAAKLIHTTRAVNLVVVRRIGYIAAPTADRTLEDSESDFDLFGISSSIAELVWEYAGPADSCLLWPGPP